MITYIDRHTTNGTIIVHAGRGLLDFRNMNNASDLISKQTLALLGKEAAAKEEIK